MIAADYRRSRRCERCGRCCLPTQHLCCRCRQVKPTSAIQDEGWKARLKLQPAAVQIARHYRILDHAARVQADLARLEAAHPAEARRLGVRNG